MRKAGSYIYEDFMPTDGTDVKVKAEFYGGGRKEGQERVYIQLFFLQVYTVGPDYAHAEARMSPALDGKVRLLSGLVWHDATSSVPYTYDDDLARLRGTPKGRRSATP